MNRTAAMDFLPKMKTLSHSILQITRGVITYTLSQVLQRKHLQNHPHLG